MIITFKKIVYFCKLCKNVMILCNNLLISRYQHVCIILQIYFLVVIDTINGEAHIKMDETEDKKLYWFAAKTKPRQEKFIKERLNDLGVNNFIPLRLEVRQWKYRKKKVLVPIIPHLVFVQTDQERCFDLINKNRIEMWYLKDYISKRNLIIPEKQMNDFMTLLNAKEGNINIINPDLEKGDKVIVIEGPFKGIEGELVRVENKSKVIVNLKGIVAVSVEIEGAFLEKIKE